MQTNFGQHESYSLQDPRNQQGHGYGQQAGAPRVPLQSGPRRPIPLTSKSGGSSNPPPPSQPEEKRKSWINRRFSKNT